MFGFGTFCRASKSTHKTLNCTLLSKSIRVVVWASNIYCRSLNPTVTTLGMHWGICKLLWSTADTWEFERLHQYFRYKCLFREIGCIREVLKSVELSSYFFRMTQFIKWDQYTSMCLHVSKDFRHLTLVIIDNLYFWDIVS